MGEANELWSPSFKVCTLHICLHCPQLDLLGATWEEISKQAIQRKKQRNTNYHSFEPYSMPYSELQH